MIDEPGPGAHLPRTVAGWLLAVLLAGVVTAAGGAAALAGALRAAEIFNYDDAAELVERPSVAHTEAAGRRVDRAAHASRGESRSSADYGPRPGPAGDLLPQDRYKARHSLPEQLLPSTLNNRQGT